jgi:rod shape-determining protein MreC
LIRSKKKKKFLRLLLISLLLLVIVSRPSFLSPVKMTVVNVFKIPIKITSFLLKEVRSIVSYRKNAAQNYDLKKDIDRLQQGLVSLEELRLENERLKKLLSFRRQSRFKTVAAAVIARDPSNWVPSVIIDKGKKQGIDKDMAVITELGLVGKVVEVGSTTSKVILINDPDLNVPAMTQRSREIGVISGTILGSCRMRYISLDADLEIGDKIITAGLSQMFPKGIFIGEVVEIRTDPSGLMKLCLVKPAVNLSKIEEVLVILK